MPWEHCWTALYGVHRVQARRGLGLVSVVESLNRFCCVPSAAPALSLRLGRNTRRPRPRYAGLPSDLRASAALGTQQKLTV